MHIKALTKQKLSTQPESSSSYVITLQPALIGLTATSPYHRKLRRVRKKEGGVRKREKCAHTNRQDKREQRRRMRTAGEKLFAQKNLLI